MDESEAEASAAVLSTRSIIYLIELIPDVFLIVWADSDSSVVNPTLQPISVVSGANLDRAVFCELCCVVEEQE